MNSSDIIKVQNGLCDLKSVQKVKTYFKLVFPQTTIKIVPGPGNYENKE